MAEQNPTGLTGGAQAPVFGSGETSPEAGENIQVAQALFEALSEAIAQAGPEGSSGAGPPSAGERRRPSVSKLVRQARRITRSPQEVSRALVFTPRQASPFVLGRSVLSDAELHSFQWLSCGCHD